MQCSIGLALESRCRSQKGRFKRPDEYSEREMELLHLRTSVSAISSVCLHHESAFLSLYHLSEKVCSNPFKVEGHKVKKALWTITPGAHDACKALGIRGVYEGRKLCISCHKALNRKLKRQSIRTQSELAPADPPSTAVSPPAPEEEDAPAKKPRLRPQPAQAEALQEGAPSAPGPSRLYRTPPASAVSSPSSVTGQSQATGSPSSSSKESPSSGNTFSPRKAIVENVNKTIAVLGVSPLANYKIARSEKYVAQKEQQAVKMIRQTFKKVHVRDNKTRQDEDGEYETIDHEAVGREFIGNLVKKYQQYEREKNHDRKIETLSLAPSGWSNNMLMKIFGASRYMVEKMREYVKQQGFFCEVERKFSRPLPTEIVERVEAFYREQDISRELPGSKQFVSVKTESGRVHKQKRLVLANLKEIYFVFKEKYDVDTYPEMKIGFTTFARLRPPECVLAGAAGTHVVCVCTYHQNMKLMFEAGQLGRILNNEEKPIFKNYRDLLLVPLCSPPSADCHLRKCSSCPGLGVLQKTLEQHFHKNLVEKVTYSKWVGVDRAELETVKKNADEFISTLLDDIPSLIVHDYISKKQSDYYKFRRDSLAQGDVLVVADFSENYSFSVQQNSGQALHWKRDAATVFPFACYYRPEGSGKVLSLNLVIISDYMTHSTAAFYAFQHLLVEFLKEKLPGLKKIIYFSDGAGNQFKNRFNMINLLFHVEEFGVAAEWHFFATAHGKGPSDGLGGTLKRLARRASLQLPADQQIRTPLQLYTWACANVCGLNLHFVSEKDVEGIEKTVKGRFSKAPSVDGIRSLHSAIPLSREVLAMKVVSTATEVTEFRLRDPDGDSLEDADEPQRVTRAGAAAAAAAAATSNPTAAAEEQQLRGRRTTRKRKAKK